MDERDEIIERAQHMNRPLNEAEKKRVRQLHAEKVEAYLDAGVGACWLQQDAIAQITADALNNFEGDRYHLWAWCIMPNHVHVVVQSMAGNDLSDILHSWKSFTAKQANALLNRTGPFWQAEYYDHLIRYEEDFLHCIEYVWSNPDRAKLLNWKWCGLNFGRDATV